MRVVLNGELLNALEARVSALDEGLLYGYGLFETLRAIDGRMPLLDRHLDRLHAGAEQLGIEVPRERADIAADLGRVVEAANLSDARVRLTLTLGSPEGEPALMAMANPYQEPASPYDTCLVRGHPGANSPTKGLKSLSYLPWLLAREQARSRGYHEALMTDDSGQIVEGSTTNVFAVLKEGFVATPPLESGALPGVSRAWVMERLGDDVREAPLVPKDLYEASEVFLTNALVGVIPAGKLGERVLATSENSVAKRLKAEFDALFR
ncbi:MAG TPA: aminotransferase class IV [Stenomitos sp.]